MGYYTHYTLEVKNVKTNIDYQRLIEVMTDCTKYNHNQIFNYALIDEGYYTGDKVYFDCFGECKWYDSQSDMESVSSFLPEMTFKLSGEGEESGDFWYCLFKNGKSDYCAGHIVYDEPQQIEW